ncbi:MAG TPA: hypothetical protein VL971_09400 [Rhizomicrobium sp.]|nr:hypothetical protein [Rhizomicrobium sp.]
MSDVVLTAQFQELSSALQRRASFVQRPDYKAQITYVADLLDRSAENLQPASTKASAPYQAAVTLGQKVDLSV